MGGGEQYLTSVAGSSTLVGVRRKCFDLGTGKLCFKYSGSTQPASTAGWREIGSWTLNNSAETTTTMTPATTVATQTLTIVVDGRNVRRFSVSVTL